MVKIIWTKKAKIQLEKLVKYIKETQSKYYTEIVLNGILNQVELLKTFSKAGQKEPILEYKKFEYRYLVKWSYKIIYRVTKNLETVYIIRIFHTAQ